MTATRAFDNVRPELRPATSTRLRPSGASGCGFRSRGHRGAVLAFVRSDKDAQTFILPIGDDVKCVRLRPGSTRAASREGGIDAEDRELRWMGGGLTISSFGIEAKMKPIFVFLCAVKVCS